MDRPRLLRSSHARRRPALVGAIAAAALVSTALLVPDGDAPAYAADTPAADTAAAAAPALRLDRARAVVRAPQYQGRAYVDLGVHAVAGEHPFEVRVTRPSYSKPLRAVLVRPDGDVVLPRGTVREDWGGLTGFFRLTVTDAKGKKVVDRGLPFCPGSDEQVRRHPDAPSTSPYPSTCRANAYGLGQVWGLEGGFSTPVTEGLGLPLARGLYTARLSISPAWATRLGLAPSQGAATVKVRVVKASDDDWYWYRSARRASADSARTAHGAHGGHAGMAMRHTESTWDDPYRSSPYPAPSKAEMRTLARDADPESVVLPDLRSLPAWGMRVQRGRWLQFSATVWNAGPSPLVVDGFQRQDDRDLMDAFQYFYDADGKELSYAPVGTMEWDARKGHNHWHFTDFASYRLLDADKKEVVRSRKEAFCLANTDVVDYTQPGANWHPDGTDLHTSCGRRSSVAVRQTLEAGSGDTYLQFLPGQSFDLRGLANGTYYVQVLANPEGKLQESSTTNNSALRRVVVSGKPGKRTVRVPQLGVVKEPRDDEEY